jgi:hypothetical protein
MATGAKGRSVFAKYIEDASTPVAPPSDAQAAQELLNWMHRTWPQPTIRARDIYRLAIPKTLRKKKNALELTRILERRGYLVPLKTDRRDMKEWRITLGP